MTIRNLDPVFAPTSVAVIGASRREGSVGRVVLSNIVEGGFVGEVYPVNPKYDEVLGLRCYHRVAELPIVPDLAVIMTPPTTVPPPSSSPPPATPTWWCSTWACPTWTASR